MESKSDMKASPTLRCPSYPKVSTYYVRYDAFTPAQQVDAWCAQQVACCAQLVARNKLRWCKRGISAALALVNHVHDIELKSIFCRDSSIGTTFSVFYRSSSSRNCSAFRSTLLIVS